MSQARPTRAGAGHVSVPHQQGTKRTRDDAGSYGGVQHLGIPQSAGTVPSQQSHGSRRSITCYGCGKTGHMQAQCRSIRMPSHDTSSSIVCYGCGQPGHKKNQCTQRQTPTQSIAGSSHQPGDTVTQSSPYQPAQYQPALLPPPSTTTSAQASRVAPPVARGGRQQGSGLHQGRVFTVAATPRASQTTTPTVEASQDRVAPRGISLLVSCSC